MRDELERAWKEAAVALITLKTGSFQEYLRRTTIQRPGFDSSRYQIF
jgi:hypothetical protein